MFLLLVLHPSLFVDCKWKIKTKVKSLYLMDLLLSIFNRYCISVVFIQLIISIDRQGINDVYIDEIVLLNDKKTGPGGGGGGGGGGGTLQN